MEINTSIKKILLIIFYFFVAGTYSMLQHKLQKTMTLLLLRITIK